MAASTHRAAVTATVLVSGLGLMGGSVAASLCRCGWTVLLSHRRPEVAKSAEARGYGRAVADAPAAIAGCDLAVVCTPVAAIAGEVRRLAAGGGRAVITDVGSCKAAICADLTDLAAAGRFVGSHPMAGSHLQGLDHARADLYDGCVAVTTPTPTTPPTATAAVEEMWRALGARVVRMSPDRHDRAVAAASHLPHVLASACAAQLDLEAAPLAASGFRDTTRIAAGSPALWRDILLANGTAVRARLAAVNAHLAALGDALERGDGAAIERWLSAGQTGRRRFEEVDDVGRTQGEE